jgi:hypothetical protein
MLENIIFLIQVVLPFEDGFRLELLAIILLPAINNEQ